MINNKILRIVFSASSKWYGPFLIADINNNVNNPDTVDTLQAKALKITGYLNTEYGSIIRVVALQYDKATHKGQCIFSTTLKITSVEKSNPDAFPASQLIVSYISADRGSAVAPEAICTDNAGTNYKISGEKPEFNSYLLGNNTYLTDPTPIKDRPYRCYREPSPGCGGDNKNPFNQFSNKCYCNVCVKSPDNLCIPSTCPVDCKYSEPTPWSSCEGPCAVPIDPLPEKYAENKRTQTVTQAAKNGGKCECDDNKSGTDCKVNATFTTYKPCVIQPKDCSNEVDCKAANLFWITRADTSTSYGIPSNLKDGESSCTVPPCTYTDYCSCTDDKYKEYGYTCNGIADGRTPVPGGADEDCWPTEQNDSGHQCCSMWGVCPPGWPAGQPCCNNDGNPCPCPVGPDGRTRRVRCGGNARGCGWDCQNKCCSVTGPGPSQKTNPNPLCPKPYSAPKSKPYYQCDSGVPHYYFTEYDNKDDPLNSCDLQCKKTEKPRVPKPGSCIKIS